MASFWDNDPDLLCDFQVDSIEEQKEITGQDTEIIGKSIAGHIEDGIEWFLEWIS